MRRAILCALTLALAAPVAHAFPTGEQFDLDPMTSDGAGGIAFTGAPRWAAHTCAVCHTDAPRLVGIRLESDHPELFTTGWKPKSTYHLRVILTGEWAGVQYQKDGDNCGFSVMPYHPCDENGFALEMDDSIGRPLGTFAPVVNGACATGTNIPTDVDVRVLTDGTAVTHNGAHMGQTAWDLCWTAPEAGFRTITAYVAAVDGNGGNGTIEFPNDTVGDDVAAGAVPLPEQGSAETPPESGGCAAGGDAGAGAAVAIAMLVVLARRRRRARVAAAIAIVVGLGLAGGCVHVRPHQRETLAERKMKFAPDPTEDELDLHMQESREGSAGGYGSAGGGCGCN